MCKKREKISLRKIKKKIVITVLFLNASPICCAPRKPISFSERYNVFSVYV